MFKIGDFSLAKKNIENLNSIEDFYEQVRNIVGFYEMVEWEDYEIKALQRIADARYNELKFNEYGKEALAFYNAC